MSGEKVISASAIIDIEDRASAKLTAISKKFSLITDGLTKAGAKTAAFNTLDRSLSKVAAGADKAAKSVAGLEKGLGGVGSRAQSAAGAASGAFGQITRSATTAEVALLRFARAQTSANAAMARASRSVRPVGGAAPPGAPPRSPSSRGGEPLRDRYGRLIEATVGVDAAGNVASRAAKAGAELERQRVDATAAGLTPHEASEVEQSALDLSRKYPTVPQSSLMRMMRNARAATGDLEDALAVMDPLTKLRVLAQAKHPGADVSSEFETLVKGLEIKGIAQDKAEFIKYMDGMAKAMNTFGEQVRPFDYYSAFKYGRGSTRGLSEEYMLSVAPTIISELGGSSTGVAGQAFYQSIVGRRLKKTSVQELEDLGLLDPTKVRRNKKGEAIGVDIGGVAGTDLARSDPYRWTNDVLLPALAKKGITDPNQIGDHIAAIFGNSLAQQLVSILATQQQRIEKDRKNLGNAQGLVAADEYLARDPGQALSAFTSQLENLLANAASPMMPAATAALRGLADTLGTLAQAAKDHPAAASGGLAAGVVAAGAGGAWFARKVLNRLGFGGAAEAGAAGGAAGGGALSWVARKAPWIGRLAWPVAIASGVYEVSKWGYDAATDPNATHPYGKPGETAERHRREQMRPAYERIAREKAESEARGRWFAERDRREREGLNDFMGPLAPGEIATPPGRRARYEPLADVASPGGGTNSAAPIAAAIGESLDQSAAKIAEALNGHATIALEVSATPDFIVKIVRMVKEEAMRAFNLSGIGSLGANGSGVDQHN